MQSSPQKSTLLVCKDIHELHGVKVCCHVATLPKSCGKLAKIPLDRNTRSTDQFPRSEQREIKFQSPVAPASGESASAARTKYGKITGSGHRDCAERRSPTGSRMRGARHLPIVRSRLVSPWPGARFPPEKRRAETEIKFRFRFRSRRGSRGYGSW